MFTQKNLWLVLFSATVLVSFGGCKTQSDSGDDSGGDNPATYTITVTSGSHGSIWPSGSGQIYNGGSADFSIYPDSGYVVVDVLVDGHSVGSVRSYAFTNVTANHTISATFADALPLTVQSGTTASGMASFIIDDYDPNAWWGLGWFCVSIAVDSSNQPHILYRDTDSGLAYVKKTAAGWLAKKNWAGTSSNVSFGGNNSLALDKTGKAFIGSSYSDGHAESLLFTTNQSGTWEYSFPDSEGSTGIAPKIAVDSKGFAHIGYWYWNDRLTRYATNETGSWFHTDLDTTGSTGWVGVDHKDTVHVFYDTGSSIKHQFKVGTTTGTETVPNESPSALSLAFDKDDNIYLLTDNGLNIRSGTGVWQHQDIFKTIFPGMPYNQYIMLNEHNINVDTNGTIHICFYMEDDGISKDSIWYASNVGGVWKAKMLDQWKSNYGQDLKMDMDSAGNIHMVYIRSVDWKVCYLTFNPADMPTLSHHITASAGSNGSITPNGSVVVLDGGSQTFMISADSNFQIGNVLVDGSLVGPVSTYTFANVTAAHTISASFTLDPSVLLYDHFNGTALNTNNFNIPVWSPGTFVGQTQFGCQGTDPLPQVGNSNVALAVKTHNPTDPNGLTFQGTDILTSGSYTRGNGLIVTMRAKFDDPSKGLIGGLFLYAPPASGTNTLHDEIDFELYSNDLTKIHTNVYAQESLGKGNPGSSTYPSGTGSDYHTYQIQWLPNQVAWYVDGNLVNTMADPAHIPAGPMYVHMNIWVPGNNVTDAYDANMLPVSNESSSTTYTMSVDSVIVTRVP